MTNDAIYDLEAYHWIQGQVKYSTDLTDGLQLKTFQGGNVTISVINGTTYVNAAKIIDPDFMMAKGVLHLMDM